MKKYRKQIGCAVLIVLIQLALFAVLNLMYGNAAFLMILLLFLATAAILGYESDFLRHQIPTFPLFRKAFFPYGIQMLAIAAFDGLFYYLLRMYVGMAIIWLVFGLLILLFSTLVVFAVGAARTMLYADRK
ncbi:MAG: hypothetical protein IKL87_06985 [Oscillospiraceae bacterium]|nr:hypothetical protein [Oscillospiraceae bacterium]